MLLTPDADVPVEPRERVSLGRKLLDDDLRRRAQSSERTYRAFASRRGQATSRRDHGLCRQQFRVHIEITEPSEHPSGQLIGAERTVGGQRTQAYPLPSFEAESDFIPIRSGQLVDVDQQPGKAG